MPAFRFRVPCPAIQIPDNGVATIPFLPGRPSGSCNPSRRPALTLILVTCVFGAVVVRLGCTYGAYMELVLNCPLIALLPSN